MENNQEISTSSPRLRSIDFLRGLVMVIMAIDHVRVYSGIPAGGLTPGIFFTRWITHFCAPAFFFLAGTSALLFYQRTGSKNQLVHFLITRGLILVLLEMTVIRFFWMFNLNLSDFAFTGVIWALGWCMILLPAFIRFRAATVGYIGLAIIFFQQLFQFVPAIFPSSVQEPIAKFWSFFYPSGFGSMASAGKLSGIDGLPKFAGISIFYVIIPWIGVMMAGYGFRQILGLEGNKLKKICLRIGIGAIALFVVAGSIKIFLEPPSDVPFLFRLLGQQKYPPSQLYILMTIGPLIALVPWAEKAKGWLADALTIIGRVPMFYYLLHILSIHLSALVVNLILSGSAHGEWYVNAPFVSVPEDQRWSLILLYLVWAINVVVLYFASSWYARYKSSHPKIKWMKYI
jgi:uncharacterized membrane protein